VRTEDLVKKRVVAHLRQVAGVKSVDIDKPLKDLGVDSITSMELIMDIEREFNINIPDDRIEQLVTARAVINLVQTLLALHV
jgi:acyl carrier protein